MTQKTSDIYSGKNGMLYVRTDSGGIALTDAVKKLYGTSYGGVQSQYASAVGAEADLSPASGLIEQYSAALKAGETARTNAALETLNSAAMASDAEYDTAAKQLYAAKTVSDRAMANKLASSGLYNSGYSDSARLALENQYASNLAQSETARRNAADSYRLEGIGLLSQLAAAHAEADAKGAEMALGQYNADRDYELDKLRFEADKTAADRDYELDKQKFEADRTDAERDYALELQKYNDLRADSERDFAFEQQKYADILSAREYERAVAERAYADTRADIEWERAQMLASAADKQTQQAIDNAYRAAEMGDFSQLEALGIDASGAKAAYQAELELIMLKLSDARAENSGSAVGGASGGGSGSSGGGKTSSSAGSSSSSQKDTSSTQNQSSSSGGVFEVEFATDMAKKLVDNMQAQGKSYSEVLQYISSIRDGTVRQFGEEFWNTYVEVISKNYPGGSGYKEPEEKHLSSMDSVMAFIGDSKNATRFFTDEGYNLDAIRELINNADLSEAERKELRTYYGISVSKTSGKVGTM